MDSVLPSAMLSLASLSITEIRPAQKFHNSACHGFRLFYTNQMCRLFNQDETSVGNRLGKLTPEIWRRRNVLITAEDECRFINFRRRLRQISVP